MTADRVRPYFLLALLAGAFLLTFAVFQPFLGPLALAAVFAVVLYPVFKFFLRQVKGQRTLASLLTILFSIIAILIPLFFVGFLVFNQAASLYSSLVQDGGSEFVTGLVNTVTAFISPYFPQITEMRETVIADLQSYATAALSVLVGHLGAIVSSIGSLFISLLIFFIALYYLLKDGASLKRFLVALSPLADRDDETVFRRLEASANSVIRGNLSIALIQAVVSGIGFTLFGLPNPVLWALVTFFAAMVPAVGTALILVPAVLFLFFTGNTGGAVGLAIWGAVAVGLVDNFLGPKLIGRGTKLHPLLILLAVLGGLALFGPIGLFLGPLTVSLLFALLSIYTESSKA